MKRKTLLSSAIAIMCASAAYADTTNYTGIIATVEGSSTAYAINEMPQISYTESNGVKYANIFIASQSAPQLTIELKDGKSLVVEYGTYIPTGVDDITSKTVSRYTLKGKKYISGGKLVIVDKNGHLYNADGTEIK